VLSPLRRDAKAAVTQEPGGDPTALFLDLCVSIPAPRVAAQHKLPREVAVVALRQLAEGHREWSAPVLEARQQRPLAGPLLGGISKPYRGGIIAAQGSALGLRVTAPEP
jgi:hypothetical protein